MRVMVFVKATPQSEQGFVRMPEIDTALADMERYNDDLRAAGILRMAEGLQPSSEGKRVNFDGPSRTVCDGPFEPASEQVAGFWLWEVENMAEAIEWVKRCPNPMSGPSKIEIRRLSEEADLR